jgi:hypothetical protein
VHRLARSEVVPPGSSLVEIDLIEQPDGTLPAPDPHRPAQCRVAVDVCPGGNNQQDSEQKPSYVLDTNNHVGSLFSTAAPVIRKAFAVHRWDNPLLYAWTALCQRLPSKKAHRAHLRRF